MPACKLCVYCNNLEDIKFKISGKEYNGCWCKVKKFDDDLILGYYSIEDITKPVKSVKDISDNCDKWDDRLKRKDIDI